jgi:gliding motility-associated-like protein
LAGYADGQGNSAVFQLPTTLIFNGTGDLLVADAQNNIIRRITPAGVVNPLAGYPEKGYIDGNDFSARFWQPVALALAKDGNLYVTDYFNHLVRMISPDYIVSTYAGNHTEGSANGPRNSASFKLPTGLAIDAIGNLYVSDDNNLIRRISKKTGEVSTIAGNGLKGAVDGPRLEASFNHPIGLTFDHAGNLYVADEHNNKIRKITLTGGYSIDKSLPAGMVFNAVTGEISGQPTVVSPPTDYTVTAYNNDGESSAVITISVYDPNVVFLPIPAKTICDMDFLPGATGPNAEILTYTSSNPAVATITVDQKIHITGTGSTTITVTDGAVQQTQTLVVNELPKPTVSIILVPQTACEGDDLIIKSAVQGAGNNPNYQWRLNGLNTGTNSSEYESSSLKTGDIIECIVTNVNDFCVPVSSALSNPIIASVTPRRNITVVVSSSQSKAVCPGVPITFTAMPSPGLPSDFQYVWTVNGMITGSTGDEFTSSTLENNDVVACSILSEMCNIAASTGTEDQTIVKILPISLCEVNIPNVFSPNHDGLNDTWVIPALVSYPRCLVSVHNRHGQVIYQSMGYQTPWDGSNNGRQLPVGTYYYIIKLSEDNKRMSGPVSIIR